MCRSTDNIRESSFAKPIEDIAKGQGYDVQTEFPIREKKKGRPRSVDFLLVNHKKRIVVSIETKYKKTDRTMAGSLSEDAAKLDQLTITQINTQIEEQTKNHEPGVITGSVSGYELIRAVLVVWHQSAIMAQLRVESTEIKNTFRALVKAMLPDGIEPTHRNFSKAMLGVIAMKPVANKSGSLRSGSTVTRKRFWVASFIHKTNWKNIIIQ
ncbi:hypothetical protein AD952_01850 [Acetobacter cerevisiae]|nr:hypothetical protein AD952_01850 [Acetobacter cerevisiae]